MLSAGFGVACASGDRHWTDRLLFPTPVHLGQEPWGCPVAQVSCTGRASVVGWKLHVTGKMDRNGGTGSELVSNIVSETGGMGRDGGVLKRAWKRMGRRTGQPREAQTFESDATEAVLRVRTLFVRAVEQRVGGDRSVTDIAEAFGIHRKLAWQVSKVAYSEDPLIAARHIPSGKSLQLWLGAAGSGGISASDVESMRDAVERFEGLSGLHAADRAEFELLLDSCGETPDPDAAQRRREQAFEGNSFTWGVRCRVLMGMMVLTPSEDRRGYFHIAQMRGLVGFRQLRSNVRWIVNQAVVADDAARPDRSVVRIPLDAHAAAVHGGVPVLPKFCSSPMPRLERRISADGMATDEFLSGAVGLSGERTLYTGELIRNLGLAYATPENTVAHFGTGIRTPAEMLHMDMFVHRSLFEGVSREVKVFSDLGQSYAFGEDDVLPVPVKLSHLGRGVSLSQSPHLPGYSGLAGWVFEQIRADAEEHDLYRVTMAYPPMPATVMFRHPLPAAGG